MGAVTDIGPGQPSTLADVSRIFTTSLASVYPRYVTKVEKKGRTKADLDQVIGRLAGFDESELSGHIAAGTTFEGLFADARLDPSASSDHRGRMRCARGSHRRSAHAQDPLAGQAGRRAGQAKADGEDTARMTISGGA